MTVVETKMQIKLVHRKIIIELIISWIFINDNIYYCLLFFHRGITLVCLKCDFLADSSGLDRMAKHLSQRKTHTCQVIIENGMYI